MSHSLSIPHFVPKFCAGHIKYKSLLRDGRYKKENLLSLHFRACNTFIGRFWGGICEPLPADLNSFTFQEFLLTVLDPQLVITINLFYRNRCKGILVLIDCRWYASSLELLRCAIVLLVDTYLCIGAGSCGLIFYFARVIYIISATIWTVQCLGTLYLPPKKPKNE